ncbi:MAG TPA: tRNA epoxyqueuosine(34) reductase QueG [Clostridiaceae bacterium]|nr:tRNA epoxyqueuosine(34) reductase QueG [Clostridiaceae bacterium]
MNDGLKKKIEEKLYDLGLNTFGFMKAENLKKASYDYFSKRKERDLMTSFEETDVEKKVAFLGEMPGAKTILSVAFPYVYDTYIHSKGYFSLYTLGQDYHVVVKRYLEEVAEILREQGYEAKVYADNNGLPERYIAQASFVGDIGRNHMLITKNYGSYVFLGEILTDCPMETRERGYDHLESHEICGSCSNCIKACPTSILGTEFTQTKKCMSYITQSKEVTDEELLLFKGRLFGCDTCQRTCPLNKGVATSTIQAFEPKGFMKYPDLKALASLTNAGFLPYKATSSGWRGKKLLQRNALIELMRRGERPEKAWISTEYLARYYHRLENLFNL